MFNMNPNAMSAVIGALRGNGSQGFMNGLGQGMAFGQQVHRGKGNQQPPAPVEARTGNPYAAPTQIYGTNPYGPPPGSMAHKPGTNNLQAMIDAYYAKKNAPVKPVAETAPVSRELNWADMYGG